MPFFATDLVARILEGFLGGMYQRIGLIAGIHPFPELPVLLRMTGRIGNHLFDFLVG